MGNRPILLETSIYSLGLLLVVVIKREKVEDLKDYVNYSNSVDLPFNIGLHCTSMKHRIIAHQIHLVSNQDK